MRSMFGNKRVVPTQVLPNTTFGVQYEIAWLCRDYPSSRERPRKDKK
jgi:hypothetical protein